MADTRFETCPHTDPCAGEVRWAPAQSLWICAMTAVAIVGGAMTVSVSALIVFVLSTAITLCFGHSLGMHRLLVHRSYRTGKALEYWLVWLGVLVGLAGPLAMIHTHDLRDWTQRQGRCHDYFAHRGGMLRDAWWQLHCRVVLHQPPSFRLETEVADDPVYRWLERTWMAQQLVPATLLYLGGGVPWVIWGVCCRVTVSVLGHWCVGYFAHHDGERPWAVPGAGVQGTNLPWLAWLTMGESWHNNHHAFPASARIGLLPGQADPGWWCLRLMQRLGWVWAVNSASLAAVAADDGPAPAPASALSLSRR